MNTKKTEKPGEIIFHAFLLAVALFFLWQSLSLMKKKPGTDGPAAVPLLVSAILALCTLTGFLRTMMNKNRNEESVIHYLFPMPVVTALGAILIYCVMLGLGLSFWILTPVFLLGLMTAYEKERFFRNILCTVLCTGILYVIFTLLFRVVIP